MNAQIRPVIGHMDAPAPSPAPLLDVRNLSVTIRTKRGPAVTVDDVSFALGAGRTLGLVGESGCGKSMTCLAVMGILPRQARASGAVRLAGKDLLTLPERRLEQIRGRDVAMVFQDPHSALNPVRTIGTQITESLRRHRGLAQSAALAEARRLLDRVKIAAAGRRLSEYPHEFSGGMCQRVMIALAIACGPRVLIADEPTTALDVTVQAQILALLREIQSDLGMALVLVTHDLGVIAQMAETVAVMYAGRIVERAPVRDLFARPLHPYTQALLGALPHLTPAEHRLTSIPGVVPEPLERPRGCAFHQRCAKADNHCIDQKAVPVHDLGSRSVACHRVSRAAEAA
jgi:peptide/nickel transport system ATP-binding protein